MAVGGGLGTLLIMILALVFGFDPQTLLQQAPDEQPTQVQTSRPQNSEEEELKQFVAVVLAKSGRRLAGRVSTEWTSVSRTNAGPVYGPGAFGLWNGGRRGWTVLLSW